MKMVLSIKVKLRTGMLDMAMVFRYGLTEPSMKVIGKMASPVAEVNSFTLTVMSTMVRYLKINF
jgi:hypothetical protein